MGAASSTNDAYFAPEPAMSVLSMASAALPYGNIAYKVIDMVLKTKKYGATRVLVADLIERGERAALAYRMHRKILEDKYGDILTGQLALPPPTEADDWETFLRERSESIIRSNDAMGAYTHIMQHFTLLNQAVHRLSLIESVASWMKSDPDKAKVFLNSPLVHDLFRRMTANDAEAEHIAAAVAGGSRQHHALF